MKRVVQHTKGNEIGCWHQCPAVVLLSKVLNPKTAPRAWHCD
jgi:hypothetical protein